MTRHVDAIAECRRLIEVCQHATPGRWKLWGMSVLADVKGTNDIADALPVTRTTHESGLRTWNATHIAAHDPAFMLKMHRANLAALERHVPARGGHDCACGHGGTDERYDPQCPDKPPLLDLYAPEPQP